MDTSSKYVSTYKYRNDNGAGYGNKNLIGTSTVGAPVEQDMSENYEESSTSSSMIQGFDSRSSCSVKSSTRDGKFHESSQIRHTGRLLVLSFFSWFLTSCICICHVFMQGNP